MNFTLREIISVVFRYKYSLLLFSLYLALGLGLFLQFSKKWYASNAEILVRFGQEQLGSATLSASERNVYFARREQEIQNEIRILTSNDTLMAAARIIAPDAPETTLLKIRTYLSENLEVTARRNSDIVSVSLEFPDPETARDVLAVVLEQYQIHHGVVYFDNNELELTRTRMNAAHAEYAAALEALTAFETENRIYDEGQIAVASENRESQRIQLSSLISEFEYTKKRRDEIQASMANLPQSVLYSVREVRNGTRADFLARLAELKVQKASLLSRYQEDSQTIQNIQREIDTYTGILEDQPERFINDKETRRNETWLSLNNALLDLNPEVEAQKARIEVVREQIERMDEELSRAASNKTTHALLSRDVALKKEIYDRFYQNYTEAIGRQEAQMNTITNASVVEAPSLILKPARPNKKRLLALGAAILLAGNAFILGLRIFSDSTVSSPEQAERALGLPVVGVFGNLHDEGLRDDETGGDAPDNPEPSYEGQRKNFRQLYTRTVRQDRRCALLFTSSSRDAGRAVLAENFAVFSMKYQQRKPALVVYRPEEPRGGTRVYTRDPVRQVKGIDEYLRSDNVDVGKERTFMEELRNRYDLVVLSYAPLQEGPALISMVDQLDWVVYDIQAERTNRYQASNAIETLKQFGFERIGLILSDRKFHIPAFLYKYL